MNIQQRNTSKPHAKFATKKLLLVCLLCGLTLTFVSAAPLGTAFTYSGRLKYQNKPADGTFDLLVKLFDAPTGGNQIGQINLDGLACVNGLFVTNLDFGTGVFDGTAYWLDISARPGGNGPYTPLSPRQPVNPAPYALYSPQAGAAATADSTAANSVSTVSVQNNAITSGKIATGQVVKSLNSRYDDVLLQGSGTVTVTPNGNTIMIDGSAGPAGWSLTGNSGISDGVNFLGTTEFTALEFKVNNQRALRLEPARTLNGQQTSKNVIGGYAGNVVNNGALGATIGGGGYHDSNTGDKVNEVSASWGTIGGGAENVVSALYGTIPGGRRNEASGVGSFAAGQNAHAIHEGSFIWGDGSQMAQSTGTRRFEVLATGGSVFYKGAASPPATLFVQDDGGGVGVFVGDLSPFGQAAFESNLSSSRTHAWFAENGVVKFAVTGGGEGYFAGNLSVCSLTIRGGCDLAEPFQMSEEEIPKGSVVIIDEESPGRLKLSNRAYDTRVAGIVSGAGGVQPGIQMSQKGALEGTASVALNGRVYVLADASDGAIKPGDLLTTSATPGHAMKVTDHARAQGAVLGKAISALADGKGIVLVLVTLQ